MKGVANNAAATRRLVVQHRSDGVVGVGPIALERGLAQFSNCRDDVIRPTSRASANARPQALTVKAILCLIRKANGVAAIHDMGRL